MPVVHPFLFALFPVISLYVRNLGKGYFWEVAAIAAGILVSAALLWLLVFVLVRDRERSALITSAFFVLFFSYGHARTIFGDILSRLGLQARAGFLVDGEYAPLAWAVVWAILLGAVAYVVTRRRGNLRVAMQLLNVVGLTLVVMVGVTFLRGGGFQTHVLPALRNLAGGQQAGEAANPRRMAAYESHVYLPLTSTMPGWEEMQAQRLGDRHLDSTTPSSRPDIYYIILDMYIRPDYLKELYGYDASELLSFLEERGFYVPSLSRSNYPYTAQSLASSLNMIYLDEMGTAEHLLAGSGPFAAMIKNSRLVHQLRQVGYTFVTFSSAFWFTDIEDADVYIEPPLPRWTVTEFQAGLIDLTPLSIVPFVRGTQDDMARTRILYTLDHTPDATQIAAPTFVFAHVPAPHDPWVFGPNGEPVPSRHSYTYDEYVEAYRDQVAFIDKKVMQLVDEILTRSPEPPIIILQSDHGTIYGTAYDEHVAERTAILNAYYFPDGDYAGLYPRITPVNSFRVVLDNYFGADYELLDDRVYYPRNQYPAGFEDVTSEARAGE